MSCRAMRVVVAEGVDDEVEDERAVLVHREWNYVMNCQAQRFNNIHITIT